MSGLIQLEVNVNDESAVGAETGRQRVDAGYMRTRLTNGIIHDEVPTGFDDFEIGNTPILFDSNLNCSDEAFSGIKKRGGLFPLREKAIVNEFEIPRIFRRIARVGRTTVAFAGAFSGSAFSGGIG